MRQETEITRLEKDALRLQLKELCKRVPKSINDAGVVKTREWLHRQEKAYRYAERVNVTRPKLAEHIEAMQAYGD